MSEQGKVPQSDVLKEAKSTSMGDMMALDPETLTPEQEKAIIEELRAQRARFQAAEASGKPVPRTGKGEKKTAKAILQSQANVDDLGL